MTENQVKNLIKNILIKLVTDEWVGLNLESTRRYNKKCFFKLNTVFLAGLFFVYNTEILNNNITYEFNSIISVGLTGESMTHDSIESFASYLLTIPDIVEVDY